MVVIASSIAKNVGDLTADTGRVYSDKRSGENKYSYCILAVVVGRVCAKT